MPAGTEKGAPALPRTGAVKCLKSNARPPDSRPSFLAVNVVHYRGPRRELTIAVKACFISTSRRPCARNLKPALMHPCSLREDKRRFLQAVYSEFSSSAGGVLTAYTCFEDFLATIRRADRSSRSLFSKSGIAFNSARNDCQISRLSPNGPGRSTIIAGRSFGTENSFARARHLGNCWRYA
jgi:hypothetical protein